VLDAATHLPVLPVIEAFEPKFHGGVRVAVGDVNGDGVPDIIAGRGPGGVAEVGVFDGATGQPFAGPLGSFVAYPPSFHGGVFLATADLNGDGKADIVVAPGAGFAPQVEVFSGADGSMLTSFLGADAASRRALPSPSATSTATARPTSSPAPARAAAGWCTSSTALRTRRCPT